MGFSKVNVSEIDGNVFDVIGKDWMLLTGGNKTAFNSMTVSWGTMGELWFKPIVTCFVRPQRYTLGFLENNEYFTLCTFDEKYKDQLKLCGTKSGRDTDKIAETGFTPFETECGAMCYEEASMVLVCKKMYADDIKPECIIDHSVDKNYENKDYHRVFIGEIIEVLKK